MAKESAKAKAAREMMMAKLSKMKRTAEPEVLEEQYVEEKPTLKAKRKGATKAPEGLANNRIAQMLADQINAASEIGSNEVKQVHIEPNESIKVQIGSNEAKPVQKNSYRAKEVQTDSNIVKRVQTKPNKAKHIQTGSNEFIEAQIEPNEAKEVQTGSNRVVEQVQIGSTEKKEQVQTGSAPFKASLEIGSRTGSNRFSEPISESGENSQEKIVIRRIEGAQKALFLKLYASAVEHEGLVTGPIVIPSIADEIRAPADSVRTILKRANQSKILKRIEGRRGIGGFSQFEFSPELFALMQKLSAEIGSQIGSSRAGGSSSSSLSESEKPKASDVGANGERSSPSNEDQATARQPTPTTASVRAGAITYQWAHTIVIPLNVRREGIGEEQMEELEEYALRKLTPQRVQQSVNQFSKALDKGMQWKKVNGKKDWAVIPAVFMEAMKNKGYFKINGEDDPIVQAAEGNQNA